MSTKAAEFDPGIIGRMVWGSLYTPNTKDYDGNPLVIKKGPDAGKPTQRYEFGVAVPKTQVHFSQEPGWGTLIWATAHAAFPGGNDSAAMRADFSWKIQDGDSTVISPKSKSKVRPCDREGYAGHWVLTFSSSFAPSIYDARDITKPVLLEGKDAIVPGYVVQVLGNVAGNAGASPGVYLNHNAVALRAFLPEIRSKGVDTSKFGGAVNIPGATTVPTGAAAVVPAPLAAAPTVPPAAPPPAAPTPTAVVPAPALLGIPTPAVAPAAPVAPVAPAMRSAHKGIPYASYVTAGWTEAQLRADGYAG